MREWCSATTIIIATTSLNLLEMFSAVLVQMPSKLFADFKLVICFALCCSFFDQEICADGANTKISLNSQTHTTDSG